MEKNTDFIYVAANTINDVLEDGTKVTLFGLCYTGSNRIMLSWRDKDNHEYNDFLENHDNEFIFKILSKIDNHIGRYSFEIFTIDIETLCCKESIYCSECFYNSLGTTISVGENAISIYRMGFSKPTLFELKVWDKLKEDYVYEEFYLKGIKVKDFEELSAEHFLDIELKDDETDFGGISFIGETLRNFLDEVDLPYTSSLKDVNQALIECGIKQILVF